MSHPKNPAEEGKPDFSPEAQADESHGSVKGSQLSGRNDPETNNPRGAAAKPAAVRERPAEQVRLTRATSLSVLPV